MKNNFTHIAIYLTFLIVIFIQTKGMAKTDTISISFYSETIAVPFDLDMLKTDDLPTSHLYINTFYSGMQNKKLEILLQHLNQWKTEHHLNDWLYFHLLSKTVEILYSSESKSFKTLALWFLLNQSDFDARIAYLSSDLYIYIYTKEQVYNTPSMYIGQRNYINLTTTGNRNQLSLKEVYLVEYYPNPTGKSFIFSLMALPKLKANPKPVTLTFQYQEKEFELPSTIDATIVKLLMSYPTIDEQAYFNVPLSEALQSSLIPILKSFIADKNELEAVEFLLAFTRTAFQYKRDEEHFGANKPMIAEEVLYYPYSDCEDRSALFFLLVKELLNLPMIVLAYPEHLTIGVSLNNNIGTPIYYNNKTYTICDPTGPANVSTAGIYPDICIGKPYEIIEHYLPQ